VGNDIYKGLSDKLIAKIKRKPPEQPISDEDLGKYLRGLLARNAAMQAKGGTLEFRVNLDEPIGDGIHGRGKHLALPAIAEDDLERMGRAVLDFALRADAIEQGDYVAPFKSVRSEVDDAGNISSTIEHLGWHPKDGIQDNAPPELGDGLPR
jgi:hypothetical protein